MTHYEIESPRSPEEFDELRRKGEISKLAFGFKSGEKADWAYIDAYMDSNSGKIHKK